MEGAPTTAGVMERSLVSTIAASPAEGEGRESARERITRGTAESIVLISPCRVHTRPDAPPASLRPMMKGRGTPMDKLASRIGKALHRKKQPMVTAHA